MNSASEVTAKTKMRSLAVAGGCGRVEIFILTHALPHIKKFNMTNVPKNLIANFFISHPLITLLKNNIMKALSYGLAFHK
jgi:hypothetical protein